MAELQGKGAMIRRLEVGTFENNCYILTCPDSEEVVIIDPASEGDKILEEVKGKTIRYILITHGHHDHIGALGQVKRATKAPVGVHPLDAKSLPFPPDLELKDGDMINFGSCHLKVLHTPGHTAGSVCFLTAQSLLSGDTIFPNGPGNTDLPGGDYRKIIKSIREKIFTLPEETIIYPGHGLETTVGREKSTSYYEDRE